MKQQLRTIRGEIRTVAARWKAQYGMFFGGKTEHAFENVYWRLLELDTENCTAQDVTDIIGNDSWINLSCDGCDKRVGRLVTVCANEGWDCTFVDICLSCVSLAFQMLTETKKGTE